MSNWWDNDETVATATEVKAMAPQQSGGNWWDGDEKIADRFTDPDGVGAFHAKRLMEARRQDADTATSAVPAIIREPFHALAGAGASVMSTVARPFSKGVADYFSETGQQISTRAESTRKDDWAPWLSRMYGGAVESLAQATVAAPAGPAGIIGSFALTEGNQALYDAEQAGLKGNERLKYAAVQGAIEGTIAGVFQRFAPGLERLVPQIASGAMKTSGKQFLISTAQELPEELLTELGHAITEAQYGIDPNAMSPEQIGQRMLDTVAQTILTMGIAHGTAKIAQNRQAVEVLEGIRSSESKDIKRKAAEVGITGSRSEVRKQVDSEIDRINSETKQIEQAVQPQEPSDEVRQEVPVEQGAEVPAGEGVQTEGEVQPEVLNREQARLPDASAALEADRLRGLDDSQLQKALETYQGRPGRFQDHLVELVEDEIQSRAEAPTQPQTPTEAQEAPEVVPAPETPPEVAQDTDSPVGTLAREIANRKVPLTSKQIRQHAQRNGLDPTAVLTAVRKLRSKPVHGEELEEQRRRSAEGVRQSELQKRREEQRQERFASEVGAIHEALLASGWKLDKESESGSRYYSRGNELARVSDHPANEATQAWIDRNGVQEISRLEDVPEATQEPEKPKKRTGRKVKPETAVAPPKKRVRKPKPPKEPETLIQAIQQLGGLSSKKLKAEGVKVYEDIKQFGGIGVFKGSKKGAAGMHDLEEIARELESSGYWYAPEDGNFASKGDALLQAIKAQSKTVYGMEKEVEREYAEYQAQIEQEIRDAEERGEGEGLRQGLRDGQETGIDEGLAGETEAERQAIQDEIDSFGDDSFDFGANVAAPQGVPGEQQALFQKESQGSLFNISRRPAVKSESAPQRSDLEKIEDDLKAGKKKSLPRQKTIDTDEGEQDFGKDVSGTLGAANVAPITLPRGGAGKSVQHFFQRFFTSRGELPQEVYDAKVRKEGRVAKEMARLRFASTDFRRGITKALGGKELTQADVERINSVLRGEADRSTIPTELHAPLQAMRDHIDSLSRALIAEGVAQGDLIGIIDEHMGVYATRSYRIFDDPKWRDKVPPAIRNRAVAAIREQYPDKSDAEVQGLLESLLFRGAADTPVALLKGSKLGSKDLSTFMKRQEIPEWLRDLWGEYKDAGVNYARSVFKMSHLLANQQFLNSVKESGSGKWLRTAEEGPVVNDYGEVITPIASEGSAVMAPLNGMYTTPEIKRAFERLDSPGALPEWLRVLMAVNSAVKYSKTVGSMMTHIRNLISNTGFAIANNHWRLDKANAALWGTTTGLFKLPDAKFRAYYERAAELLIVGEDVRAGELKDALRDASQADIDEFLYDAQARQAKKIVRTARSGFRIINSLYHAEDAVWKLYAWENEKARYAAAYPEWSQEQVEQRAAEIVRDTYPTYSKIPEAIKGLRRFPLAGTFVSFPSEVVRTTFHTIQLGLTEMQSPETRSIGAGRLAGTTAAIGALSLLSRGMMALFSIGDDEDDDLRWFVPPWQENSRFIYTAPPENGTYKFVDLGYSDPHAYITDAAIAFMRGDDWQDSLTKALTEFLRPFASEEILAKTLMDVRGNADQSIYNPRDAAGEQARDIITHVWEKSLEPGTIASLRRIRTATEGTDPNLEAKTEVLALTTGQRLQKVDVEHSLGFRVRDFAKALNEIQSIARKTATSRGTVTGEMVSEDRERMEQLRLEEFSQMQRILGAARRLGVPEENIRAMVTGELSDEVAKQVLSGEYVPYKMTTQTVQQMLKANPGEFKERFSAWHGDQLPEATAELRRKRSTWPALRKLSEE